MSVILSTVDVMCTVTFIDSMKNDIESFIRHSSERYFWQVVSMAIMLWLASVIKIIVQKSTG